MREPVRAPRAAWRMSRQSAERSGSASCMASKSAAKTVTLAAQISANRMELASLPLEKSAARLGSAGMFAKDRFDAVIDLAGLDFLLAARVTNGRMATNPYVVRWWISGVIAKECSDPFSREVRQAACSPDETGLSELQSHEC